MCDNVQTEYLKVDIQIEITNNLIPIQKLRMQPLGIEFWASFEKRNQIRSYSMGEQKRFLGSAPKVVSNYNEENRHCTRAVILHPEGLTEGDPGLTPAKFQMRIRFAPLQDVPASLGSSEEWPLPTTDGSTRISPLRYFTPSLRHAPRAYSVFCN